MGTKPLTLRALKGFSCGVAGCAHDDHGASGMFLHGRCHLGQGSEVEFKDGILFVRCRICKKSIADFKVAEE